MSALDDIKKFRVLLENFETKSIHDHLSDNGWKVGGLGDNYHHPDHPNHTITASNNKWHHYEHVGDEENTIDYGHSEDSLGDHLKNFHSTMVKEDSQSPTGNALGNGQDMSTGSDPNHTDDSKKIALISNFSRNLNPKNAQHATDALTSMYKGTRPSGNQVQALVEIVANVFKACEANPSLIGTITSNMKRQAQQK